jgi:ornithine cyclodeaminase/alanine dehydrogenase-like protein (mu-crystallin family)
MVGLGNIGTCIGKILFELIKDRPVKVKLYRYKNHAEHFVGQFSQYSNLTFEICNNYDSLMVESDVVFSSVTFMEKDFCDSTIYKKGCTVIPVHMRGFKECDKAFDHVITSDLESIKKFQYYGEMRNLSRLNDVLKSKIPVRVNNDDRVIVYNLGIALYDIYFASRIFEKL